MSTDSLRKFLDTHDYNYPTKILGEIALQLSIANDLAKDSLAFQQAVFVQTRKGE